MAQSEKKLTTPVSLLVDAVLVIVFFCYMFTVMESHVPSYVHSTIVMVAAATASCLTGVFWLALQMFRVVFSAQREAKRNSQH